MSAVFVYFILPSILLVLGLPIFLVLLVTCLVAVLFVADVPTEAVQTYMFGSLDNFPLLAVPFFVLAGDIMAQGGIARRVVEAAAQAGVMRLVPPREIGPDGPPPGVVAGH